MIQEDYLSFETAKLLKEKGFDEPTLTIYRMFDDDLVDMIQYNFALPNSENGKSDFACPTLQMAMKWLREVHHLHITVFSSSQESWMYRITKPHQTLEEGCYGEDYTSYEEACDDAIKQCLTKLI